MSLVSIIIPNYNHSKYLQQRIDSVLNQTFQDIEVIILDDCSTDNSNEIIEQYRNHPKVAAIIYNEINSGTTFKQWNKGFGLAKGEYIWIAESDDWADSKFLETLIPEIEKDKQLGLIYCDSYLVEQDGEIRKIPGNNTLTGYYNNGKQEIIKNFIDGTAINNVSAVVFRKEKVFEAGLAPENFKLAGDWFFYVKLLLISDIRFVATKLNYFRQHQQSVRHQTSWFRFNYEKLQILYALASALPEKEEIKEKIRLSAFDWSRLFNFYLKTRKINLLLKEGFQTPSFIIKQDFNLGFKIWIRFISLFLKLQP